MRKELLKGLTDEQIKKVEECKDSEEVLALAKAEGVQLSDEQLEAVSGGCGDPHYKAGQCPKCKTMGIDIYKFEYCATDEKIKIYYDCPKCGRHKSIVWQDDYDDVLPYGKC